MKIVIAVLVLAAVIVGGLYIYSGQIEVERTQVSERIPSDRFNN